MMDPQTRNLFADMGGASNAGKTVVTTEEIFANDDKLQDDGSSQIPPTPTGSDSNVDTDSSIDKQTEKNGNKDDLHQDIRRNSHHDKDLQKIYIQQSEINEKTAEIKSNMIPNVRRSNRSNKGVQREMFDPSHIPSPKYSKYKPDMTPQQASPIKKQKVIPSSDSDENHTKEKQLQKETKKVHHEKQQKVEEEVDDQIKEEEEKSDSDSDDEYNDPNRLWCICKKPHNGRFMISCDVCEEWFHGDCVGVTVQRGKQMEKKGEEYVCPSCLKSKGKQPKHKHNSDKESLRHPMKTGVKLKGYAHDKNNDQTILKDKHSAKKRKPKDFNTQLSDRKSTADPSSAKQRKCIVASCPNKAPSDSVYCSNVCILRHAKESLGGLGKSKSQPAVSKKSPAEARQETKEERVVRKIKEAASRGKIAVMCRKTGKIFANASAPLKAELETFLKKNPTFKPLKLPKNFKLQMQEREEKSKAHHSSQPKKNNDQKHLGGYSHDPDYKPMEVKPSNPYKALTPSIKHSNDIHTAKKHKIDRQNSNDAKKSKHKKHDNERRHSTDKHANPQKITPSKRDSRSLSDDRNDFKKDSAPHNEKEVRRSVKKTLQGILQARSNSSDDLKMHPDSITRLVNKIEESLYKLFGSTSFKYKSRYRSISFNLKDEKNHGLWRKVILGEVTSSSLVKMTAEEMASKELSQWRKHELTQELEMIHEIESAEKNVRPVSKITHKGEIAIDEDYSDLTESHLETSHEKVTPTIAPQRIRRISANQPDSVTDLSPVTMDTTSEHNNHLFDMNCMICTGQVKEEEANLDSANKRVKRSTSIILSNEAQSTLDVEHSEEEILKKISAFSRKQDKPVVISSKSEEEPSQDEEMYPISPKEEPSQVDENLEEKKAPSSITAMKLSRDHFLWTGVISMPELSSFRTNAYTVSGGARELVHSIPNKLVLDGRIHPKVVWEYLAKVKTFPNKEVCVVQFRASSEEDRVGYVSMLSYFSSRKRFGVVSNQNTQVIKDIYLVPLLETEDVPKELLPLRGPGLPTNHPSMLLGVIVRCIPEPKKLSPLSETSPIKFEEKHHKAKILNDDLPARKSLLDRNRSLTSVMPHFTQKIVDTENIGSKSDEEEEYNPETADFENISDDDPHKPISPTAAEDEEAYDPEKVVFDDDLKEDEDDAPYDPEDEAERLESTELKALQEKQAFLEKMKHELEMKKAELAKEEMSLQKHTPPPATKTVTRVDPRVAARMKKLKTSNNNGDSTPPPPPPSSNETPLQKIFSVLNFDKTKAT
ncbi:death-inducer obliterator 1-like [Styela clava]